MKAAVRDTERTAPEDAAWRTSIFPAFTILILQGLMNGI
jgi:hypothetical protein